MHVNSEISIWTVLRHNAFRTLWLAGLTSQIGTWMQSLGAQWLMTEMTHSPLMVGTVQAAQLAPAMVLGPLTGALVDMFDRRRFLIVVMSWQMSVTLVLAILTFLGLVTPWVLIGCIFCVGVGNSCQGPAMSANLQEIVPREEVMGAITLNAMALNISRSIGPALAGAVVGIAGEGPGFLVNSLCYGSYLTAVARKVPRRSTTWTGAQQRLWDSVMAGFRYARKAKRFRNVLIRSFSFFCCGNAVTSLLPVLARDELKLGPGGFGGLLTFVGVGAIITGLFLIGYINRRFSRDNTMLTANLLVAAALMSIAWVREYWLFAGTLLIFGGAWTTSLISVQIAAQMVLPAWVRGRGLSLVIMSISGGLVVGALGWGFVAHHLSLRLTYTIASVTLLTLTALTYRFKISGNEPEEA